MIKQMENKLRSLLPVLGALVVGWILAWLWYSYTSDEGQSESTEDKPLYWVAPMDPNYKRDAPGKSPMGMELVPVYAKDLQDKAEDKGTVRISPNVIHNLGLRTAPVTTGPLDLEIQTVGYISFDENRLTHFHSRVDGWIEKLSVTAVGDKVEAGQQLFELYSPKLVTAGEEYLAALGSGSRVLADASLSKLKSLGVEQDQIDELHRTRKVPQRLAFFANQNGYIAMLNVREGMFIQPATNVLSIGGLDTVWVIAEIFERQAGWVEPGEQVEMTVSSYPGERWLGKVDYVYPVVDAQTRTLRARIVFDNLAHRLKPDMFVQLLIRAGHRDNALSIPREAVIRDGRMNRVVKVLGDGRYRSERIETGIESGDRVEVLKGLDEDDHVVVSAQFLIDSESSISADLSRIEGEKKPPQRVWVEGTIRSLMPDHRMATIQHDPVEAWNWPAMKMKFTFADDVDLSGLEAGQTIRFCLEREGEDRYRITSIDQVLDTPAEAISNKQSADMKGHDHAAHDMTKERRHD